MFVYTHTGFNGHYPVGTSAVVVADNKKEAALILNEKLVQLGLDGDTEEEEFEKINNCTKGAIILDDGNY